MLPLLLLLAGCAGLPDESAVEPRLPVSNEDTRPGLEIDPESPVVGSGPEAVAAGFLRAHIGGVETNYSVAREYLTGAAGQQWRPDQGVLLLATNNLSARRISSSRVVVSAVAVGQVDEQGHVNQLPTPQRRSLQMTMSQVAGQWRITAVPGDLGLWLSLSDFERLYQPKRVYFAAQQGPKVLVPDVRWFPQAGLTTALARAVIGPPPTWLAGVVRPQLPAGTRLQPNAVPVSTLDRTARVTLSKEALGSSPQEREALWAAMLQTLSQAPGVAQVELYVGSSPLEAPGMDQQASVQGLDYDVVQAPNGPVIVREGSSLRWTSLPRGEGRPEPPSADRERLPAIPSQWYQLAADSRGREIAGISGDRRSLGRWINRELITRPSFGSNLIRPVYDGHNNLWVAGQALADAGPARTGAQPAQPTAVPGPPTVWVVDTRQPVQQAQPQPVTASWLGQRDIISISVSPEGQRLALVVRERSGGRTSLLLSGIVRDRDGEVDSLAPPVVVNASVTELTSVTWADETTLGVLGRPAAGGEAQPVVVPLGGLATPLGSAPGAQAVVGSSLPQDRLLVLTNRTTILAREGRSWEVFERASDVIQPAL